MNTPSQQSTETPVSKKLLLPSLILSYFALKPPTMLVSLLLIDIAFTFNVSIGVASQIQTIAFTIAAFSALLTGVLIVRLWSTLISRWIKRFAGIVIYVFLIVQPGH